MATGAALISIGAVGATLWLPQSHWAVTPSPHPGEQSASTKDFALEQGVIFAHGKGNSVLNKSTIAALAAPTAETALDLALRSESRNRHHLDLPESIPPRGLDGRMRHRHHHHGNKPPSQLPQPNTSLLVGVGLCFLSRVKPKIN